MKAQQSLQRISCSSSATDDRSTSSSSDDQRNLRPRVSADRLALPILSGIDEESEGSGRPEYLHCIYSRRASPDGQLPAERTARARARASFDRHGISRSTGRPPCRGFGILDLSHKGDGSARPYRFARICHVCSARTTARLYCHSCGHPLCPSCTCEVPENTPEAHRQFLAMIQKTRDASRSSDTVGKSQKQASKDDEPEGPPMKPLTRQGTVSDHPFLIADREVRKSVAADRESDRSNDVEDGTDTSQAQAEGSSSSVGRPSTVETIKTYPGVKEKGSTQTLPKVRSTSPPVWLKHPTKEPSTIDRRLEFTNARARLRGSEPFEPAPVVKAATSLYDLRGKLKSTTTQPPREIKRAEIPPFRLRRDRTLSPGSSSRKTAEEERQRSITVNLSESPDEVPRDQQPQVRDESQRRARADSFLEPETEEELVTDSQPTEASPGKDAMSCTPPLPDTQAQGEPEVESETVVESSESDLKSQPEDSVERGPEPDSEPEPQPASNAQRVSLEVYHPDPIMPPNHNCAWREQYNALAAEMIQLKAEIANKEDRGLDGDDSAAAQDSEEGAGDKQEDGQLGLEGLTIVMHLKGKEDLVINTDLREAGGE